MDVCVVYCKDNGTSQDNQDKEKGTEKVQKENTGRNSENKKKNLVGGGTFLLIPYF
jgi:hypothetical protein